MMRHLILMRHARAEGASPAGGDRERPLSETGRLDAARMGDRLGARGLKPDLVIVSAARRTRETWAELSAVLGAEARLEPEDALYNADVPVIRRFIEGAEDRCDTLLLIAHNPGVHALAFELLSEGAASEAALDAVRDGFPPGAAAVFQADVAGRLTYDGFYVPSPAGDVA